MSYAKKPITSRTDHIHEGIVIAADLKLTSQNVFLFLVQNLGLITVYWTFAYATDPSVLLKN